ncbi:MAG: hypothetical protein ABIK28_17490 [Planctomycetota bacterium]
MTLNDLFMALDLDGDRELSRADLREAATRLGWGWHQAQVFAVLDLFTVLRPMSKDQFIACMDLISTDPMGPYGKVLLESPAASPLPMIGPTTPALAKRDPPEDMISLLTRIKSEEVAEDYSRILKKLDMNRTGMRSKKAAFILIDLQRAFTRGTWMQSIGPEGKREVEPIALAFERCAFQLQNKNPETEVLFSRCPFPPDSYPWDDTIQTLIPQDQIYFIKPGNSILWPPTNGFSKWIKRLLERGITTLVMGGCTLNSCVRVSAVEVQQTFSNLGLQVVVDLSLCGGRTANYIRSPQFGGLSSVALAIEEMEENSVCVVSGF